MISKEKLAACNLNLLLIGETGVGKSRLAKWIHERSERRNFPFIHVNLGAINENLFESELFGHIKGSFTGAINNKLGFCQVTGQGTLFLDEIGELDIVQQKKLLTLLEEKIFYPVGCNEKRSFKGRIIAATNKNLAEQVQKGLFRADLYYRLRGIDYELSPLRNRKDKERLIYLEFENSKLRIDKPNMVLLEGVVEELLAYNWPGNYRELKQTMDYLCIVADNHVHISNLPKWMKISEKMGENSDNYYKALEYFEKQFLEKKLTKFKGKINLTSEKINLSKATLISKVRKYDINAKLIKKAALTAYEEAV